MKNEIKKYSIILLIAFIVINIFGFLSGYLGYLMPFEVFKSPVLLSYFLVAFNILIQIIIAIIVALDMIKKEGKINIWILLLCIIDRHLCVIMYLINRIRIISKKRIRN
jgi:hypothetical protein